MPSPANWWCSHGWLMPSALPMQMGLGRCGELLLDMPGHFSTLSAMTAIPLWLQISALALLIVALHVRRRGRWMRFSVATVREVATSIVLCAGLFLLVSGGRGCAGSPHYADIVDAPGIPDAPDPFHRSR